MDERECERVGCSEPCKTRRTRFCSKECSAQAARDEHRRASPCASTPAGDVAVIASQLVEMLREDRQAKLEFDVCWPEDCVAAVRTFVKGDQRRLDWIAAMEKGRDVYRAGWDQELTIIGSPAAALHWPWARELAGDAA